MGLRFTSILLLCLLPLAALAQEEKGDASSDNVRYEAGFQLGNLLPNKIDGATEILGLGGVRVGARISPLTFAEGGVIAGNGGGVEWKNAHIDIRMDMPVENLIGIAYIGGDTVYYKGANGKKHTIFGGHAGGGLQMHLGGEVWFRSDMKFGFSPGTSLYIGFGIVFRMGGT